MNRRDNALSPYYQIVDEYFVETGIPAFDVSIVVSNDFENAFYSARPDQIGKETKNNDEYNGFCVPPATVNGQFTILLNGDYVNHSRRCCNFNWIGTIVHELTHADDYQNYRKMLSAHTYDELFEPVAHRTFAFWTEYHAKTMGEQYVMKYRIESKSICAKPDVILDEFEQIVVLYNNSDGDGDRLLEYEATLLGMFRVRQMYFPEIFCDEFFAEQECLQRLYCFLKEHETIEKVGPHLQQLHDLLKGVHPCMP